MSGGTITFRAETSKSHRSRTIPIRDALAAELVRLRGYQHRVLGRLPTVSDLVLLTPVGRPWGDGRRNALRRLRSLLDQAAIPVHDEHGSVDLHALRHTFVTRLARAGVSQTVAQHLAGHSDPRLTAQVYTHLGTEDMRAAVESLPAVETSRPQSSQSSKPSRVAAAVSKQHSTQETQAPTTKRVRGGARGGIRTRNPCFTKADCDPQPSAAPRQTLLFRPPRDSSTLRQGAENAPCDQSGDAELHGSILLSDFTGYIPVTWKHGEETMSATGRRARFMDTRQEGRAA